jgi:rhodanese-related sulfurtransferase
MAPVPCVVASGVKITWFPKEGIRMDPQEEKRRRLELAQARVPQVDAATVDGRIGQGTVVIDVRDADAHAAAHIDGSVNIEGSSLAQRIAALVPDRATPILCYCNGGSRGPLAALALQELGYRDVGAIEGGLRAYTALGSGDDAPE